MGQILDWAIETLKTEGEAIINHIENIDASFETAVEMMNAAKGKVVVTGMGKSGIIGKKIVATFASTGTPSLFLHAGEAYHGDLGMVDSKDVILALSNSGETDEILKIIPFLKSNQNKIVSITNNEQSSLALHSDIHIALHVQKEACPLELAPTTSTTMTLALGDALAVALMKLKDFKPENFARFHPGGSLGRKLLTKAKDIMKKESLPIVTMETEVSEILLSISRAKTGLAIVVSNGKILGVVTDGDIRRAMEELGVGIFELKASEIMSTTPKNVRLDSSIQEVEELFKIHKIHTLLVLDADENLSGILEINDI